MYERRQFTVRVPPDVAEKIAARATERGISENEWINRALIAALATKGEKFTIVTTKEVQV